MSSCGLWFESSHARKSRKEAKSQGFSMLSAAISGVAWAIARQRPLKAPVDDLGISKNADPCQN